MEFAVVNNYMGPVATKAMKGYSDEDISALSTGISGGPAAFDEEKVQNTTQINQYRN